MASLADHDLPSDSDDSDVDFKPSDEESLPSEDDSDSCVAEPTAHNQEDQQETVSRKRTKKQLKCRKTKKKKKIENSNVTNSGQAGEEIETKELSPEEKKKKEEALWNDFMKDCAPPPPKTTSPNRGTSCEVIESKPLPDKAPVIEKENKTVVTEIFEFAGEKIKVEKEVPALPSTIGRGGLAAGRGRGRVGGLASLVGQLNKKNKLSTLEKSKLDWDRFKKEEGIEEDLHTHNKGKEGYLDKQDFLERADLRQFEIEKQLRTTSRRSNR